MDHAFGVDIGGTNIKLGIVSADGEIKTEGLIDTGASSGPEAVAASVRRWFDEKGAGRFEPSAAGVGCAGLIDGNRGVLFSSPNLPGWKNVEMNEIFSRRLEMPVVVDNDVNCAALGEFLFGAGREASNFMCLTLGTGVGGGLVIEGELYRGFSGMAGEIGHTVVVAGGKLCGCGSRGCLEAYVGANAIVERARRYAREGRSSGMDIGSELTVKDISRAAGGGDEAAAAALARTGYYLGIGLANSVHLVNPEIIAIGGGVAGAGDLIMEPALESMRGHLMGNALLGVRVVQAELGNSASFIGAAVMAMER